MLMIIYFVLAAVLCLQNTKQIIDTPVFIQNSKSNMILSIKANEIAMVPFSSTKTPNAFLFKNLRNYIIHLNNTILENDGDKVKIGDGQGGKKELWNIEGISSGLYLICSACTEPTQTGAIERCIEATSDNKVKIVPKNVNSAEQIFKIGAASPVNCNINRQTQKTKKPKRNEVTLLSKAPLFGRVSDPLNDPGYEWDDDDDLDDGEDEDDGDDDDEEENNEEECQSQISNPQYTSQTSQNPQYCYTNNQPSNVQYPYQYQYQYEYPQFIQQQQPQQIQQQQQPQQIQQQQPQQIQQQPQQIQQQPQQIQQQPQFFNEWYPSIGSFYYPQNGMQVQYQPYNIPYTISYHQNQAVQEQCSQNQFPQSSNQQRMNGNSNVESSDLLRQSSPISASSSCVIPEVPISNPLINNVQNKNYSEVIQTSSNNFVPQIGPSKAFSTEVFTLKSPNDQTVCDQIRTSVLPMPRDVVIQTVQTKTPNTQSQSINNINMNQGNVTNIPAECAVQNNIPNRVSMSQFKVQHSSSSIQTNTNPQTNPIPPTRQVVVPVSNPQIPSETSNPTCVSSFSQINTQPNNINQNMINSAKAEGIKNNVNKEECAKIRKMSCEEEIKKRNALEFIRMAQKASIFMSKSKKNVLKKQPSSQISNIIHDALYKKECDKDDKSEPGNIQGVSDQTCQNVASLSQSTTSNSTPISNINPSLVQNQQPPNTISTNVIQEQQHNPSTSSCDTIPNDNPKESSTANAPASVTQSIVSDKNISTPQICVQQQDSNVTTKQQTSQVSAPTNQNPPAVFVPPSPSSNEINTNLNQHCDSTIESQPISTPAQNPVCEVVNSEKMPEGLPPNQTSDNTLTNDQQCSQNSEGIWEEDKNTGKKTVSQNFLNDILTKTFGIADIVKLETGCNKKESESNDYLGLADTPWGKHSLCRYPNGSYFITA